MTRARDPPRLAGMRPNLLFDRLRAGEVCLGDGAGGFSCSALGWYGSDTALGDVDDDGDLDVVLANPWDADGVCLGDGAGNFGAPTHCMWYGGPTFVSWATALFEAS